MHRIVEFMTTDDEGKTEKRCRSQKSSAVDFVSAPFIVSKMHLFEGADDETTFFRNALRNFLVHNILINLDINVKLNEGNEAQKELTDCELT